MNVSVTGATGFIGQHFLRAAARGGHRVLALTRRQAASTPQLTWATAELADIGLASALSGCDVLVHLAAAGVHGNSSWDNCYRVNVLNSLACWQSALAAGVKRLVIVGSCFEYGRSAELYDAVPVDAPLRPIGAYASSKAAATLAAVAFAQEAGVEMVVLRPFHTFGEGEAESRFWPSLKKAALAGEDFPMTLGDQIRDMIPVEEVADKLIYFMSEHPLASGVPEIHNLGTGRAISLRDFARTWWRHWGARGNLRIGAVPYRSNEVMRYVARL